MKLLNKKSAIRASTIMVAFLLASFVIAGGFGYSLNLKTIVGEVSFSPSKN